MTVFTSAVTDALHIVICSASAAPEVDVVISSADAAIPIPQPVPIPESPEGTKPPPFGLTEKGVQLKGGCAIELVHQI